MNETPAQNVLQDDVWGSSSSSDSSGNLQGCVSGTAGPTPATDRPPDLFDIPAGVDAFASPDPAIVAEMRRVVSKAGFDPDTVPDRVFAVTAVVCAICESIPAAMAGSIVTVLRRKGHPRRGHR